MKTAKITEFARLRETAGQSIRDTAQFLGVSERTVYRWDKGEKETDAIRLAEMRLLAGIPYQNSNVGEPLFRFIDLFAGIGGLRRGFESIGGQCVFTSEWDDACRKTYQANFACDHKVLGDIREVDLDRDIPNYDVLVAGFPCQPFSISGVSKRNSLGRPHGFHCDTQGTLFFDVARIIEHHGPKAFILENVKNLKSHDQGRTFEIIMRTLRKELGYKVESMIIDGRGWVPQHRERIYIVGFKEDVGFSFDNLRIRTSDEGPRLRSILHPQDGSEPAEEPYTQGDLGRVSDKYTLSDKLWNYLQAYAEKHRAKGNGFGYGLFGPDDVARTLSARYYKDGSEILIAQEGKNPRRLTPRECARLMGFDSPGKEPMSIPVSDTQAYKQFGNSVVVPVVETVSRHMLLGILKSLRQQTKTNDIEHVAITV